MEITTSFRFVCNKTAFWNITNTNFHGGSIVPAGRVLNSTFDNQTCQVCYFDFYSNDNVKEFHEFQRQIFKQNLI
jgi:hypothetical protein